MDNFAKKDSNATVKGHEAGKTNEGRIEYELELLQRHAQILNIIVKNEPIGIIRLSNLSKFPQHKVRYSLRILEQEGLIEPSSDGAITTEKFKKFIPRVNNILVSIKKTMQEIKSSVKK
jgi:predicted transcriptional regulator